MTATTPRKIAFYSELLKCTNHVDADLVERIAQQFGIMSEDNAHALGMEKGETELGPLGLLITMEGVYPPKYHGQSSINGTVGIIPIGNLEHNVRGLGVVLHLPHMACKLTFTEAHYSDKIICVNDTEIFSSTENGIQEIYISGEINPESPHYWANFNELEDAFAITYRNSQMLCRNAPISQRIQAQAITAPRTSVPITHVDSLHGLFAPFMTKSAALHLANRHTASQRIARAEAPSPS